MTLVSHECFRDKYFYESGSQMGSVQHTDTMSYCVSFKYFLGRLSLVRGKDLLYPKERISVHIKEKKI